MPASCSQVPIGSLHGLDLEGPGALEVGRHGRGHPRDLALDVVHPHRGAPLAGGVGEHDLGAELVVALAEDQRGDLEGLADRGLRGVPPVVDDGCRVHDGDASDHAHQTCEFRPFTQTRLHRAVSPAVASPAREHPGTPFRRCWIDPNLCVSVLPCEPSVDSPSVPSCPSRCAAWATWPPTCAGPGTPRPRTCSRRSTPRSGAPAATTRSRRSVRCRPPASRSSPPTSASCAARAGARRPRAVPHRRPLVPEDRPARCAPKAIAYFSPEYGITSVLPQYSGGLGILAGDHLKTASDLGVPLIGVGLLYQHGYFRQQFSREGWQQETYPVLDPDGLPITLLREDDGTPAQVRLVGPRRQRAGGAHLRGAGRPRAAAAARHRRRGQPAAAARGHRPALRRHHRAPPAPGAPPRASAGSARCAPSPGSPATPSPRSSTPTRATPASSASSGSASSPSPRTARDSTSTRRSRSPAPARCSPRTPPCPRASTGSRASWWSSTSAAQSPWPASRPSGSCASAPRTTPAATAACSTWP